MLVLTFVGPELLLLLGIVPVNLRHALLFGVSLTVMYVVMRIWRIRWSEVGLVWKWEEFVPIAIQTVGATIVVYGILGLLVPIVTGDPRPIITTPSRYLILAVGVFFQELLCRGFAIYLLNRLNLSDWLLVWGSAAIYGFTHLHYYSVIVVAVTFAMGVLWGAHYVRFRTIVGVTLAHLVTAAIFLAHGYLEFREAWGIGW